MSRYLTNVARIGTAAAALIVLSLQAVRTSSTVPTDVRTTEIAPNVYVLSVPAGNALVVVEDAGCFYAGAPIPPLVGAAKALAKRLDRQFRYAMMMEEEAAPQLGDGGWGETGALTIAQENLYRRMRKEGAPALPMMSFSAVVQLWGKTEEIHLVHNQDHSGYSNSDSIVHLEKSHVLYTGNLFTSDGYPSVRLDRGGSVAHLIAFAEYFIRDFGADVHLVEPIVPGRGPLATMQDLREYSSMLIAVSRRIGEMATRSYPLKRILELEPTKEFDARWGRGPVSPADFTVQVYESVKKDLAKSAPVTTDHDRDAARVVQQHKP